jgi:hypothetical protein
MNFSLQYIQPEIPLQECKEWCLQQHFTASYEGVWLVALILVSLSSYFILNTWGEHLVETKRVKDGLLFFSWIMSVMFFYWFLYAQ